MVRLLLSSRCFAPRYPSGCTAHCAAATVAIVCSLTLSVTTTGPLMTRQGQASQVTSATRTVLNLGASSQANLHSHIPLRDSVLGSLHFDTQNYHTPRLVTELQVGEPQNHPLHSITSQA